MDDTMTLDLSQADEEDLIQTHDHEFLGSTRLAEEGEDRHNHRFAGMTSMVIPTTDSHIHAFFTETDFFENHYIKLPA